MYFALDGSESQNFLAATDDYSTSSLVCVTQSELDEIGAHAEEILSSDGDMPNPDDDQDHDVNEPQGALQITSPSPAKKSKVDPFGRGRKLDDIWNDFHKNQELPATKVQCNNCGTAVSKKVERLKWHIEHNCKSRKKVAVSRRKSVPETEKVIEGCPSNDVEHIRTLYPGKKFTQSNMTNFVDSMGKDEQTKLNLDIGRYIFASNLAFSHVENPAFVNFVSKLRPACKVPSRKVVGNSLLEKVFMDINRKQEKELHGKTVTIIQDGWKSRTSEPVISHSLTTGTKSYFLSAVSAEDNEKTSGYCAMLLCEKIREVNELGADVVAVVTDNCNQMTKMRELVKRSFPKIFTYGCHPHLLNLVGKRVTPEAVLTKIRTVHTFFRNHDAAWANLKKKKCARPKLPHEIRWNAWIECLEYYISTHTKLLEVSRIPGVKCTDEIRNILNDGRFYSEVESAVEAMKPVQIALDSVRMFGTDFRPDTNIIRNNYNFSFSEKTHLWLTV